MLFLAVQVDENPKFLFVPTLLSSVIKADSVLRQQWPRGMYSKVSLATGLDAGEAVLRRGRAHWGCRTCMYCTLHEGGEACHEHRGSTPRKTAKLRLHQNQRANNHQELTITTYRGALLQNRKTHTPGWKVKQAESLKRVHTVESGTAAASEAYLPNGGLSELGEREASAFSVGRPCKLDNTRARGCRHRRLQTRVTGDSGRLRFSCRTLRVANSRSRYRPFSRQATSC